MKKKRKKISSTIPPHSNSPPAREREVFMLRVSSVELQRLTKLFPTISVRQDVPEDAARYVHECIIRYQSDMCVLAEVVKEACAGGMAEELQDVNSVLSAWFWDSLVVPVYDSNWTKQKWLTPEGKILGPRLVTVLEKFPPD